MSCKKLQVQSINVKGAVCLNMTSMARNEVKVMKPRSWSGTCHHPRPFDQLTPIMSRLDAENYTGLGMKSPTGFPSISILDPSPVQSSFSTAPSSTTQHAL
jgi:hypothetical protein